MNHVTATIITYNPELSLLENNLSAVVPQVSRVLIYDNGSSNAADIQGMLSSFPSVELVENGENLGLPANYNKAARKIGGGGVALDFRSGYCVAGRLRTRGQCVFWSGGHLNHLSNVLGYQRGIF